MTVPVEYRFLSPVFSIDPGFVHHRALETFFGRDLMKVVDEAIRAIPAEVPEWLKPTRIDHIYTRVALESCRCLKVPTLEVLSRTDGLRPGLMFCSTDQYGPCPDFFESQRGRVSWISDDGDLPRVVLEFSTGTVRADTLRSRLHRGTMLSVIGKLAEIGEAGLIFDPWLMGFPWLSSGTGNVDLDQRLPWFASSFYEHHVEDIDEFARIKEVSLPDSPEEMRYVSESSFKRCLGKILGDESPKDWGGERSDYFSAHLHLRGQRINAAFLLKGPANFRPMEMIHCGAKADQIYRLSQEPVDLLVLQHCHDVLPVVRAHLRAFAVSPAFPKRYCVIDGRDSLRLLQAFGLLAEAQDRRTKK